MSSRQDSNNPKRTIKKTLASCAACRRRRTRCDRLWPCSECEKRKSDCDYEGARSPLISAKRRFDNVNEYEQYIQQLEARLEALEQSKTLPEKPPAAQIDFVDDDLAFHLSRVTLGPRIRSLQPRALETKAEALLAKLPAQPTPAIFLPELTFNMSLIPTGPPKPIGDLQASLPPRAELDELAGYFFQTLNVWSYAIEPGSWPKILEGCYRAREPTELTAEDIHQLATVLIAAGHGLLFRASVHQSDSKAKLNDMARAHRFFNLALGALTQPDQGAILTRPSIWGIRAMALLTNVELSPEDFDHALFFWSLTSTLAESVGLFREPPGLDATEVDELELESRRNLAWSILANDWVGGSIMGGRRRPVNLSFYEVQIPGKVGCEVDPTDGWPLEIEKAMQRAFAMCDQVMFSLILFTEQSAPYDELLKVERRLNDLERIFPERLQIIMSPDRSSIQPKLPLDPYRTILCYAVWNRLMSSRVRVHRPFIFLKEGIPDTERSRHLQELDRACRIHFLMYNCLPRNFLMSPLVMFTYVNTCIACALVLVACPKVFDATFFLPHLGEVVNFMGDCSQNTIASSLARRAEMLLKMLMAQAEQSNNASQPSPKRLHGLSSSPRLTSETSDIDQLKHKSTKSASVIDSESVSSTDLPQFHKSNELAYRPIAPLKSPPPPSLALQDQTDSHVATVLDSTDEGFSTTQIPSPPCQTSIDWSLMGGLPFTFRLPSLSLFDSDSSGPSPG